MAPFETQLRRLLIAGGFAIAVAAAPVIAAVTVPSQGAPTPVACITGEEEDLYTNVCVPHTVPNSPMGATNSPFTQNAANPDIPEINGIPCTGRNYGECIGLEQNTTQPLVRPNTSVNGIPTG